MSSVKLSCDVGHRLKLSRFKEKVLRSVEERLDVDMGLKGVRKSIDQTLAVFGVVYIESG